MPEQRRGADPWGCVKARRTEGLCQGTANEVVVSRHGVAVRNVGATMSRRHGHGCVPSQIRIRSDSVTPSPARHGTADPIGRSVRRRDDVVPLRPFIIPCSNSVFSAPSSSAPSASIRQTRHYGNPASTRLSGHLSGSADECPVRLPSETLCAPRNERGTPRAPAVGMPRAAEKKPLPTTPPISLLELLCGVFPLRVDPPRPRRPKKPSHVDKVPRRDDRL